MNDEEVVKLVNQRAIEAVQRAVKPLCEHHGYGFVMQAVSEMWRARDPVGALSLGPAFGVLEAQGRRFTSAGDAEAVEALLHDARSTIWKALLLLPAGTGDAAQPNPSAALQSACREYAAARKDAHDQTGRLQRASLALFDAAIKMSAVLPKEPTES